MPLPLRFAGWWVKVWKNDGAADNRGWGRSGIRVVLGHVDAMLGYVDWGDVGAKLGSCWAMWRLCWASLGPRCSNYLLAGGDCVGDDIAITFDRDLVAYLRTTASSLVGTLQQRPTRLGLCPLGAYPKRPGYGHGHGRKGSRAWLIDKYWPRVKFSGSVLDLPRLWI